MISDTLGQLAAWYDEPTAETERSKLLSKLAVIELCGWLEVELDRIILAVQAACLDDEPWVRKEIVDRTYGFKYLKHFRPMLSGIIGEYATRTIEREIKSNHPGDIERLISYTNALWETRCSFAHADVANNVIAQQTFDAPHFSKDRYRIFSEILPRLEATAVRIASQI